MIGVILAAGRGTRLLPLTEHTPKCLVSVAGTPLLEHQLKAFGRAGVSHAIVLVGHHADKVKEWLGERVPLPPTTALYNADFATTNNMYSLFLARDHLRDGFVSCNGDVAFDETILQEMVAFDGSCVATDLGRYLPESMKVVAGADGSLSAIAKTVTREAALGSSIDLYKFSPDTAAALLHEIAVHVEERGRRQEWVEVAIDSVLARGGHDVVALPVRDRRWVEVDDLDDLAEADRIFSNAVERFKSVRCAVLDLDGTMTLQGSVIEGARELVAVLEARGVAVFYCTNNSARSAAEHAFNLAAGGLSVRKEQIISSIDSTADYLARVGASRVAVLGTPSLVGALQSRGFEVVEDGMEMIVVGFDRTLTFARACWAARHIAAGVPYLLTHSDAFCPTPQGPEPDAGAIDALLRATTGARPRAVLGKPNRSMVDIAMARADAEPGQTLVVGDRLSTDVRLANVAGCLSVLVLSGASRRGDVENNTTDKPDLIVKDVGELASLLQGNDAA